MLIQKFSCLPTVHHVFENVAEKYDLMNDLMSAGIHRAWKDYFLRKINPRHGNRLLDVAGGTGDIAMRYLNYLKYKGRKRKANLMDIKSEIIVCDVNQAMLDVGKRKAEYLGIDKGMKVPSVYIMKPSISLHI